MADQDSLSLDNLSGKSQLAEAKCSWTIDFQIEGQRLTFKLDTGAEVTAITEKSLKMMGSEPLSKSLYGPTSQALKAVAQFIAAHLPLE